MALATEDEILLAVNSVLQDYEAEVIGNPSSKLTRIRVVSRDRVQAKTNIEDALSKENITWVNARSYPKYQTKWPPSSFSGTVVESSRGSLTEFVYKNKGGGGSGAGAEITKLTESAQCVFAAVRQVTGKSDSGTVFNPDNIKKAAKYFDIPNDIARDDCKKMRSELTEDWITSCDKGAEEIVKQFPGNTYTFHRGSSTVDRIEGAFKRVKKKEGVRMDINKWSPADMYLISSDFDPKCLLEENSFRGLNQCMQERIQKKVCIGVSLKKMVGNAKIVDVNIDPSQKEPDGFARFEFSDKSMDGYIHCTSGAKIQFRGFAGAKLTGWQGEVSGKSAKHGKISLGPINLLIKNHVGGNKMVPTGAARFVTSNRQQAEKDIFCGFHRYNPGANDNKVWETIRSAEPVWLYSKWQVVKLFDTIRTISTKKKKDQLVEDMLLYALSMSSLSAPYYKLSD